MSARIVPMDGDRHQAVQTLLPWYVSGRLDRAEIADVEAHLAGCAQCRDELAWERRMSTAQAALGTSSADGAERGLAQLRARIQDADSVEPPRPRRPASRFSGWQAQVPWVRWALGAQFAAIVSMAVLLVAPVSPTGPYHALGTAARAAPGNLVVRFRPDATEGEIRSALKEAGARLVDGPTATDAYLLDVPLARQASALTGLRARPIVVLAESLDAGPRP